MSDGLLLLSPQLFEQEQSEWQPTSVDGKGYLLNEPGTQPTSVYGDFSCKEESEVDSLGGKRPLDPCGFSEKGEPWSGAGGGGLGGRAREQQREVKHPCSTHLGTDSL